MSATIATHQMTFTAISVKSHVEPGVSTADAVRQALMRWPLESPEPGPYGIRSFGHLDHGMGFGIDGGLDAFRGDIATHDLQRARSAGALLRVVPRQSLLLAPAGQSRGATRFVSGSYLPATALLKLVDISGEPRSQSTFTGVAAADVPRQRTSRGISTRMRRAAKFASRPSPSGLWIPAAWSIWAPVQGIATCNYAVVGLNEQRGARRRSRHERRGKIRDPWRSSYPGNCLHARHALDGRKCLPRVKQSDIDRDPGPGRNPR